MSSSDTANHGVNAFGSSVKLSVSPPPAGGGRYGSSSATHALHVRPGLHGCIIDKCTPTVES
ncbi:hypothetical protein K456DRAFT_538137 [Colletotrichum gloeosporioides 23]|nr:hypothetical protein K456DRAFT_538137 [Colletotrichum gloeosporioides 23]